MVVSYLGGVKVSLLIGWVLLAASLLRCGQAEPDKASHPPVEVGRWPVDTNYFTVDGDPAILLGFVLPVTTMDTLTVTTLIERIHAAGGNYLGLSTRGVSDNTARRWHNRANKFGLVLDTLSQGSALAGVSATVASFNLAILAGSPAQALSAVTPSALNAIRGIRVAERYLRIPDLRVDPGLLVGDRPPATMAARDTLGNYLIHIGGEGAVTVRFPDAAQVPRRVTVIGYLGTQRSEILRPPYDGTFTLTSREPRGGWMLIAPLRE